MASGLDGIVAAETILSHTDQANGVVWVRGHDLSDLVEHHGFEGTVALLWDGFAGEGLTRAGITCAFGQARVAAHAALSTWLPGSAGRTLFEGMRVALAAQPDTADPATLVGAVAVAVAAGDGARSWPPGLRQAVGEGRCRGHRQVKPSRGLPPNVEIMAALLLDAAGIPREAFTLVFAAGRSAGWLAHAMEERKTGRMIRPISEYVGPPLNTK